VAAWALHPRACPFASIPRKVTKRRMVKDALTNLSWVQDVQGALAYAFWVQFLNFFFLEHAGELRINILRRKRGKIPRNRQTHIHTQTHTHTHTEPT
jgi:hypothetical protein